MCHRSGDDLRPGLVKMYGIVRIRHPRRAKMKPNTRKTRIIDGTHDNLLQLAFQMKPLYNPHNYIDRAMSAAVKFNIVLSIIL